MALAVAIPVDMNGEFLGVLYGGVLLTREHKIVDTVRDTVFHNEMYEGRSFGAVSIFFNDLRISSTLLLDNERRAIGTRVSQEVSDLVLGTGERWTARAFVVDDWYLTSYEPIEDIAGNRVGILGLGVLEKKYADMRRRAFSVFALITLASMALAMGIGYVATQRTTGPVLRLIKAARQVSEGSLSPEIGSISRGEIGVLQKTFLEMVAAMGRRRTESEIRLLHSEKQASVGRLAAGVAHEINNPLTGVLTYTHMLLRRKDLPDEVRSDLEVIVKSTERVRKIVKGLLDFSRETRLNLEPTEVNDVVQSTISLMDNQALMKGVNMRFDPGVNLPVLTLDRSQIQSVLMNVIINALDATDKGGTIKVSTCTSLSVQSAQQKGVEIAVSDTGCGIPRENLDKLFEPFFTTKQVGKGTGLGLAVSYGIIQRHGGTIRVQSEQGKGSTFVVWLPVEGPDEKNENSDRG
jgi:two-component system NtrC family sensor kinase